MLICLQGLPDTLQICGRIGPEQMWDYLGKIRQAGSRVTSTAYIILHMLFYSETLVLSAPKDEFNSNYIYASDFMHLSDL